jgi:hypothetical protein
MSPSFAALKLLLVLDLQRALCSTSLQAVILLYSLKVINNGFLGPSGLLDLSPTNYSGFLGASEGNPEALLGMF